MRRVAAVRRWFDDDPAGDARRPGAPRWLRLTGTIGLVVVLVGGSIIGAAEEQADAVGWVLAVLLPVPLLWRTRRPVLVFAAVSLLSFVQYLLGVPEMPGNIAVLFALYTVAATQGRRLSLVALAVTMLGAVLAWLREPTDSWPDLVVGGVFFTAIWAIGRALGARRSYLRAVEDRAVRLERERDALARAAVAEERTRIAREMHDVVAHRVGVIVAQADGATYAFAAHPEQSRAALDVIAANGRSALTELRRMLGVLRGDDAAATAPQPGVDDIDALIAEMRVAGLPVSFTVEGRPQALEPGVGLTVYRIVQECLTNTFKHAGPGTPVSVLLRHTDDCVVVQVVDAGPGASASVVPSKDGDVGHGLIGMRERVTMLGGRFSAQPARPHGWRVDVEVPVTSAVGDRGGHSEAGPVAHPAGGAGDE